MTTGKPDMEALAQAISLMSNILGFDALWRTACRRTTQCYRSLRTMSLGGCYGRTASGYLLPSKVLLDLDELDLSAIVAHEYGHIRRRDFPVHFLCELISLPVAWHPGIRYLMSKISQTRELACDDYAAVRLGKRRLYARTLLRLASLCLHAPRGNAVGLGIFDGENLETRIMMLTEKRLSLSRVDVIGLALATSITFGAGAVLAHAMSLQAGSLSSNTAETFAGTWHWMFNGKSFSTMILVRDGSGFTGTFTPSRIALNHDGGLMRADPSENSTPSPITKANLEGSALHTQSGLETSQILGSDRFHRYAAASECNCSLRRSDSGGESNSR